MTDRRLAWGLGAVNAVTCFCAVLSGHEQAAVNATLLAVGVGIGVGLGKLIDGWRGR